MSVLLRGNVIKIEGDHQNIDMAMGWFLGMDGLPHNEIAARFLANADPAISPMVRKGDILVGGKNFGYGKIHASFFIAMRVLGLQCIVADSLATQMIYQGLTRGMILIECPGVLQRVEMGDDITVDYERALIQNHTTRQEITGTPFPPLVVNIMKAGGHIPYLKQMLEAANTDDWRCEK